MLKTETLDELFGARDSISDQLIALTPRDDFERARLVDLMKQRDRVTAKINETIAAPFSNDKGELGTKLAAAVKQLEETSKKLKELKKTMDEVQFLIECADQVVKLAATIITLAA
jgi:hypothetical protein